MNIQQKHMQVNVIPGLTLLQGIILGIIGEEKELLERIIGNVKSVFCSFLRIIFVMPSF